jgi:hypothetical protein
MFLYIFYNFYFIFFTFFSTAADPEPRIVLVALELYTRTATPTQDPTATAFTLMFDINKDFSKITMLDAVLTVIVQIYNNWNLIVFEKLMFED